MNTKPIALLLPLLPILLAGCVTPLPPAPVPPPFEAPVVHAPITLQTVAPDEVAPVLAYHQSLRRMSQGELMKELSGLSLQQKTPKLQLQSGMVLMLTRGNGDLARAQALFDSVGTAQETDAQPLRPLAQLLSQTCSEARRLTEHTDRLQAQLKEQQRKNEQLNEMLEALKAIERGLPARPSGAASTPGAK